MISTYQHITEEKLIALLQKRDEQAMHILYAKYSTALFGVIYRILNDRMIAEDVLQDVFYKIWQNFSQYKASKGRLFTWMLNIARNAAIDKTRSKHYKQSQRVRDINCASIIQQVQGLSETPNTDRIGIKELIEQLNTKYQEVIDLLYFQGYSQAEASKELHIPLGTVKTRARTAIGFLKKLVR